MCYLHLFACVTLVLVLINTPCLKKRPTFMASYNFDAREWILIFFLAEMLPIK